MKKRPTIWYLNKGKACKYDGDSCIKPKMGYNWFYWFPVFRWNGGSLFRKEVLDFHASWLCYYIGITIYGNQNTDWGEQKDNLAVSSTEHSS